MLPFHLEVSSIQLRVQPLSIAPMVPRLGHSGGATHGVLRYHCRIELNTVFDEQVTKSDLAIIAGSAELILITRWKTS